MRVAKLVILAVGGFGLARAGAAQESGTADSQARQEIRSLYVDYDQAVARKDTAAIARYALPDAVNVTEKGEREPLADALRREQTNLAKATAVEVHSEPVLVLTVQDRAWVTVKSTGHVTTQAPQLGGPVTLDVVGVNVDAWRRTPQGWRLAETRAVTSHAELNAASAQRVKAAQGQRGQGAGHPMSAQEAMQRAAQLQCQTRMINAMGWQRQGYLAVMPSC
jgi:ketosteroid isomerase-like protein